MTATRVALIGCGSYMGHHAYRVANRADAQLVALCDTRAECMGPFIGQHLARYEPRPAVFTDAVSMYREARPDAVFIATPHTLHFTHAMQALDAGCHVFIEKPMVTSRADAYALRDRVQKAGRLLTVGFNTPATPEFRYLRTCIRERLLGRLELVVGHLSQNWRHWSTHTWRQDPALSGGGVAYDTGAHLLTSVTWSVESSPSQVCAFIDNHGSDVDINSTINIRFANGVTAALAVGGNCPTDGSHLAYIFEGGKIEVDGWHGSWINIHTAFGRTKYPPIADLPQTPDDNFLDALQGRAALLTTVDDGVRHSELMDAIYESARTGRVVNR